MQYAISDIHGHLKTFRALLKRLNFGKEDELFLLGDFIDRGPDSKGVIDYVESLRAAGHRVHCLRGNHEQLAIDAERGNDSWRTWLAHGGKESCASFGTYAEWYVPAAYKTWMEALPLHLSTKGYLMVHAGIDTHHEDPLNDSEGLLWSRNWYHAGVEAYLGNSILLHGHTPQSRSAIVSEVAYARERQVINIDNGCYDSVASGKGHLCAVQLGNHQLTFQENLER